MWERHSGIIGYLVLVIFVLSGLGILYVEEIRTQGRIMDGTTCILGVVKGVDGYERPPEDAVDAACDRYLDWVDEVYAE